MIEVDAVGSAVYLPPATYYYKLRASYSRRLKVILRVHPWRKKSWEKIMVGFEEIVAHRGLKGLTQLILSIDQNYY